VEGVEVLNCGSEKNMALVQFAYIEDSFRAIASMHGQPLNGRKIQISFTKSKLY
jgi:RNA recognition motif-containing protein